MLRMFKINYGFCQNNWFKVMGFCLSVSACQSGTGSNCGSDPLASGANACPVPTVNTLDLPPDYGYNIAESREVITRLFSSEASNGLDVRVGYDNDDKIYFYADVIGSPDVGASLMLLNRPFPQTSGTAKFSGPGFYYYSKDGDDPQRVADTYEMSVGIGTEITYSLTTANRTFSSVGTINADQTFGGTGVAISSDGPLITAPLTGRAGQKAVIGSFKQALGRFGINEGIAGGFYLTPKP